MTTPAWHEHPRWADAARCEDCGQPLIHPDSKAAGRCFRCRTAAVNGQDVAEAKEETG